MIPGPVTYNLPKKKCNFEKLQNRVNVLFWWCLTYIFHINVIWPGIIAFASVPVCVWVCGSYIVHHLNGTELCCAPPTCTVHHPHGAQGEPTLVWSRGHNVDSTNPDTENDTTPKKLITNMQNRLVHNLIGTKLRCALPKCKPWFACSLSTTKILYG